MIKSNLKRRLKELQKRAGHNREARDLKIEYRFFDSEEELQAGDAKFVFEDTPGEERDKFIINIVNTPEGKYKDTLERIQERDTERPLNHQDPNNEKGEISMEYLKREVEKLEARVKKLKTKRMRQGSSKKDRK